MKLQDSFYNNTEVTEIAKCLLGKVICTRINGVFTSGMISETEAYAGIHDKASHAYGGRITKRNEVMYGPSGFAYIYLCYGIHHLFNVVTGPENTPHAVLLRAIEPIDGKPFMLQRRGLLKPKKGFTGGPGTASVALGIQTRFNGESLQGNLIWIEDRGIHIPESEIQIGPRIGVDYAGEDAFLPYRYKTRFIPS